MTATATPTWEMPTGSPHATILGIGAHRARRVVPNADIVGPIDSSDEWIRQRSGITERRWVGPGETLESMSLDAAKQALEASGVEPAALAASFDDFSHDAPWRRVSYTDRGRYARQLDVLFSNFPREQALLLRSRDLASDPDGTLDRVLAFLGVERPAEVSAPGRTFEGAYAEPAPWSPGLLLLRWRLRGEVRRLREAYGIALDAA